MVSMRARDQWKRIYNEFHQWLQCLMGGTLAFKHIIYVSYLDGYLLA